MNEIDKINFDGSTMSIYQNDDVISLKATIDDVISLKAQNNVIIVSILKSDEARKDILEQLDALFDDFIVSASIKALSELTDSILDESFIDLLIYETIKQTPDLTIYSGYKLDCVERLEYEAIILSAYKKWINRKIESQRTIIEKTFIDYVNKDIKNDIHDLTDLKEFIDKINYKEIAKKQIKYLSTSDKMHCYDMIHKNDNMIILMNHEDGIKDLIDFFEIDYEDFVKLIIENAFYNTMEEYIISDGEKLFSCHDNYLINDLTNNLTTECAEWIIKKEGRWSQR